MVSRGFVLGWSVFAVACGDPPADGMFQGQAAMHLTGMVGGDTQQPLIAPSVGIEWVNLSNSVVQAFYPDVATIEATDLVGHFELDVFDPPDDGAITLFARSTGSIEAEIAFGYLFAFDDTDRNGTWMLDSSGFSIAPDTNIGLANAAAIYVKTAPAADSEFVQTQVGSDPGDLFTSATQLTPGFHLIQEVCGADGIPVSKSLYQIVDTTTVVGVTLFPASKTPNKDPEPPACLFVL